MPEPVQILALIAVIIAALSDGHRPRRLGFTASAVAIAASVGSIFIDLYPNVMVSSTNAAYNLTVHNAASGGYALKVMTIVAAIFLPARADLPGLVLPRVPRPLERLRRRAGSRYRAAAGAGCRRERLDDLVALGASHPSRCALGGTGPGFLRVSSRAARR